jgi:serine/threonine protein kinase
MPHCCINQHSNPPGRIWCTACESLVAGALINGDYVIVSYLKQGSMGAVYLAYQHSLSDRKIVIKVLKSLIAQEYVEDFRREASLLASLAHPYILPIHAYGFVAERRAGSSAYAPYLVLPYAQQGSLFEIFKLEGNRPWPLNRVVSVMSDAAEALDYAHGRGVIHRDIKPANLLQMGIHVVLADFGMAALLETSKSHLTVGLAGSPAFMAPEVWQFRPGRYSDQYALAVTCFCLLAAQYPWRTGTTSNAATWSYLHQKIAPHALYTLRPDLPREVSFVLDRALQKEPHGRYPTMQAFARDLKVATQDITLEGPADIRPPAPSNPAQPLWYMRPPAQIAPPPMIQRAPAQITPPPVTQRDERIVLVDTYPLERKSTDATSIWMWGAFGLNLLICLLLVAYAGLIKGDMSTVAKLSQVLWPTLFIGPLLASFFRGAALSSYPRGLLLGLLFGIVDTALSSLVCYSIFSLLATIPHWGIDWRQSGDGLRIFLQEAQHFAPLAITMALYALCLALLGGAIIGWLAARRRRTS